MSSLLAALIAFLLPGVTVATFVLIPEGRSDFASQMPEMLFAGAWCAAPFLLMRLHSERAVGRPVAVAAGLLTLIAAIGLLILDVVTSGPGPNNIGRGILMLVLPVPLYLLMLALSFVNWSAIPGSRLP